MLNVFLGAGFAQGLGLPGTQEITDYVAALQAHITYTDDGRSVPLAPMLWKIANSYYDSPNFETLLHLVESMVSARGSRLGFTLPDTQKIAFNAFMDVTPRFAPIVKDENSLILFGANMMNVVADYLDDRIKNSKMEKQETIREFFDPFISSELRISTLNYDDSIERSMERAGISYWDGFASDDPGSVDYRGFFDPHKTELLHLHGSIRFAPVATPTPSLVRFKDNIEAKGARNTPPGPNAQTQAGEVLFIGPLLSGLRKTEKFIVEPYGLYHQRFVTGLLESPRLICIGYGGLDTYVNGAMLTAKKVHGSDFKVAYITKVVSASSYLETGEALCLPANHSCQYQNEFPAFWQRLVENDWILEENGMLLIGTGFPLKAAEMARLLAFLDMPA